jgi:hypothetical protein
MDSKRACCLEMAEYLVQSIDFLWTQLFLDLRELLLYTMQFLGQLPLAKFSIV